MHKVAQRARYRRVERPAGAEDHVTAFRQWIDARMLGVRHRDVVDAVAEGCAVAARDADLVADRDLAEEREVGVAVRGVDGGALLAGVGGELDMAGAKGATLPPAARAQ